ncbi:MAG: hypothetical protein HUK22_01435 [Thermoguttaceae bacterium]|nr:hypothetical protein [Thermoguttaceae bacterium]
MSGEYNTAPLTIRTDVETTPDDAAMISWTDGGTLGAELFFDIGFSAVAAPLRAVCFQNGDVVEIRRATDADDLPRTIFPGAFNPAHCGHLKIARLAAQKTEFPTEFEISVQNVDKPPIDYLTFARRITALAAVTSGARIWATNAKKFVEKAAIFPNTTFAVGMDTIVRLASLKYADYSQEKLNCILEELNKRNVRFLIFPRAGADGTIPEPAELNLPPKLAKICLFVSKDEFLENISSSEIRRESPET